MPVRSHAQGTVAAPWAWPDPLAATGRIWEIGLASWCMPVALAALVEQRCRALVRFARVHSPFYAALYAGRDENHDIDLAHLPVVTKPALMAEFDRVVTDARLRGAPLRAFSADARRAGLPFAGEFAVWSSSGSSGKPGLFVHDADALAVYDALQFCRVFGTAAWGLPSVGMGRYAMVAATGGHFAGAAMIERLRSLFPAMREQWRTFSLMQPLAGLLAQLNEFQPDTLASYPSAALMLAREQNAGRLAIGPRQVWTGGECLGAAGRRALASTFGASVREEYGASEFPSIAVGCALGRLHVNADWVVLEPVDAHGRPVAPGLPSHSVLLTNLANRAQPLIRYDLGDAVTVIDSPCACGNPLPAIRVLGRVDDMLDVSDYSGQKRLLLPLVITTVLEEAAGLFDFQVAQRGQSSLQLWAGAPHAGAGALAALRAHLQAQGLTGVEVVMSDAPLWQTPPGGKLRRIRRMYTGQAATPAGT